MSVCPPEQVTIFYEVSMVPGRPKLYVWPKKTVVESRYSVAFVTFATVNGRILLVALVWQLKCLAMATRPILIFMLLHLRGILPSIYYGAEHKKTES